MSEAIVDYDKVIEMLDFLGVKYIEVDVSPKVIVVIKEEDNYQILSRYPE